MRIGPYPLANNVLLAPMAGITDRPFREICKRFGAGLTVSEMTASNPALRLHARTLLKADGEGESGLRSVQIVGTDPVQMAEAARFNVERGAHIIDINMGCPAKKVCSVAAGSALLRDEALVSRILDTVVNAVEAPVTLKIRTGWDLQNRNAVAIAKIAENAGVAALTVHGRTRACKFNGEAEYDTIAAVKQAVRIPVIANGDIDSAEKARSVLDATGADGVMIGRAACGNPWLFEQIQHFFLAGDKHWQPTATTIVGTIETHLEQLYGFYGESAGVKIARKHIAWYLGRFDSIGRDVSQALNASNNATEQMRLMQSVLDFLT
ncbi:tRNA dihydrouridine synthase DusB [Methylomicrobium sp. Wu6]|uniref:tRNA dihydrouridine synthase DusB n=1 Tax=Methylomicrobium sp. Wu6 TaxID=3107928 RepID=UPI002DD66B01|nr:tRNA dihydrouridine synthase DusB [Methylomicrobium sp. Wu6]MEC4747667.1 tRNA dihydrouridine synthase DusB [Methylomicrobium sp. Wu6]